MVNGSSPKMASPPDTTADHGERDVERNQRRVLETQPCRERVREIRVFDEVIDPAPYNRDQQDERDRRSEQEPCLLVIAIVVRARHAGPNPFLGSALSRSPL